MERDKLALAVAVAALVPSIYGVCLPPLSTVHAESGGPQYVASERAAAFTTAAVVAGIAVTAGSGEILVIGGAMAIAYASLFRNARKAT